MINKANCYITYHSYIAAAYRVDFNRAGEFSLKHVKENLALEDKVKEFKNRKLSLTIQF